MFKVGDVIVHKNVREERHTVLEIHTELDSITIEPFPGLIDNVMPYRIGISNIHQNWDYDKSYYRKLKLEKICTKLEIK